MLEADDGVICIAHDNNVAPGTSLPPLVDPQIVDVVEIDVGQERADDRTLWRPLLRNDQVPALEHTYCQPLGDQPDDSSIANPMFDEADQPRLADFVEKGLDVTIKHPVNAPPTDPERERIQRLMLTARRSEPVAEPRNSAS